MQSLILLCGAVLVFTAAAHAEEASQPAPDPPPMPHRPIAAAAQAHPGQTLAIEDGQMRATLYLPQEWTAPPSGEVVLAVHFHGTSWHIIDEHIRRGAADPLLYFVLGEGSSVYQRPFAEDRELFTRLVHQAEGILNQRSMMRRIRIIAVDISSFSAGYGAVRELVKSPEHVALIRRIVLADSIYASYTEPSEPDGPRRPAAEHIDVWVPFAEAASRGEKTFVLTYSQVPTHTNASTAECAAALAETIGAELQPVATGSIPAAADGQFPLIERCDVGNLHLWGYGGDDAQAHLTHIRHLADIWLALDRAR